MDEIKNVINDGSVGFLSKDGKVKSAKENADAEAKILAAQKAAQTEDTASSSDPSISKALSAVRQRTNDDISNVVRVLNIDRSNLAEARANLSELKETASELKEALSDGDRDKIDILTREFENLQEERDEISAQIEADNTNLAAARVQDINVGNRQVGRVTTREVTFEKSSPVDASSERSLQNFINNTDRQLEEIKLQIDDNRDARKETRTLAAEARAEISRIEESSLSSLKDAEQLANKVSSQLKELGESSLKLVHKNISQEVINSLLR